MKIALLGYDVENAGAYNYLKDKYPDAQFTVYDQRSEPAREIPDGVEFVGGVEDFKGIEADIGIRTPGIALGKIQVSGELTTATKIFFSKCPAPIIGVTGTKGKGTTCSLIAEMLKNSGKTVWLVGNIGTPALDVIEKIKPEDIVVYELSSFQLWDIDRSPQVAVVLMIEPDHMNVHDDMEDYVGAKSGITKYQSTDDVVVFHPTNNYSHDIAEISKGKKIRYMTSDAAYIQEDQIMINGQTICSTSEVGLLGEHNLENICAAVSAAWQYTQDAEAIGKAIREFKGLPHHTEEVRTIGQVKFYDDSFSSAPAAAVAAIKSFSQPQVVILGGAEKGADFTELVETVKSTGNIKKAILIGDSAQKLANLLESAGESRFEVSETRDFKAIVNRAYELAQPEGVVLLSPGCASFDMFKNFYERGDKFQEIVRSI